MKKITTVLSLLTLALSASLLSSCTNKKTESVSEDENVFKQVTKEEYMAALEGKSRSDKSYKYCYINGELKAYGDSTSVVKFDDSPVQFLDDGSYVVDPNNAVVINDTVMPFVLAFASADFEEEKTKTYYLKNDEYKVTYREFVAKDKLSEVSFIFDSFGYPKSVKNARPIDQSSFFPQIGIYAPTYPYKDLSFEWK